jgi:hypothetical protein
MFQLTFKDFYLNPGIPQDLKNQLLGAGYPTAIPSQYCNQYDFFGIYRWFIPYLMVKITL